MFEAPPDLPEPPGKFAIAVCIAFFLWLLFSSIVTVYWLLSLLIPYLVRLL